MGAARYDEPHSEPMMDDVPGQVQPDGGVLPGCAASPHCRLPTELRRAFAERAGVWLHYGPIGAESTPLQTHLQASDPDALDPHYADVATPAHRSLHVGDSLDVFGLRRNPGHGAPHMIEVVAGRRLLLWRVFAIAFRDPAGPLAEWVAPGFGFTREGYRHWYGGALASSSEVAEARRLDELLSGQRHRGRPPLWADQSWRDMAERAMQRKADYPRLPWDEIARAVGIHPHTLENYRRILRRDHERQLRLLQEGDQ